MKHKNNRGFTLLEIIIVIIIVAVLASLAIPQFQRTTAFARSQEAIRLLATMRESIVRCAMLNDGDAQNCDFANAAAAGLDVEVPADGATNFNYVCAATAANAWTCTGTGNANCIGCVGDTIVMDETGDLTGTGVFASL